MHFQIKTSIFRSRINDLQHYELHSNAVCFETISSDRVTRFISKIGRYKKRVCKKKGGNSTTVSKVVSMFMVDWFQARLLPSDVRLSRKDTIYRYFTLFGNEIVVANW